MAGKEEYLVAIDVGTTTTRCVVFDLAGQPVAEAYREPVVHHPQPTWTEVVPEDWWRAAVAVVREALDRTGEARERVLGVGLCGLKHALVPIDAAGQPLARAMLWMDQRCQPQAEWLTRKHGDVVRACVGGDGTMSTTPSAPKLRWIAENDPDLLRRTEKFLPVKDYIRYRLTGTIATDPSDAGGTRLYDPRAGDWSRRMLDLVGISPDVMPPIVEPTAIAGGVSEAAARATGLAAGTPVVVGGGDVQCTLIGAHAYAAGRACLYLGTAAWLSIGRLPPDERASSAPGAETVRRPLSADTFGATATTGAALRWLRTLYDPGESDDPAASYTALLREAEASPLGARGLIFLPHLMGERGPSPDPQAVGTLYGFTLAHRWGDITRALLEGCAYQLRRIALDLAPEGLGEVMVVGGGAKSALWRQILADVMDSCMCVPRVVEAGALGAAILTGVGLGVYAGVHEAADELVQIVDRVKPDGARHGQYEAIYCTFLELERRVSPLYG
jgi:xylulokinase